LIALTDDRRAVAAFIEANDPDGSAAAVPDRRRTHRPR
jgi:hypothetical protein